MRSSRLAAALTLLVTATLAGVAGVAGLDRTPAAPLASAGGRQADLVELGAADRRTPLSRGTDRTAAAAQGTAPAREVGPTRVLAISVDGLTPRALTRLGRQGTPAIHRLMRGGAGTLNARTAFEQTVTLPNHTTMVTGRRIDAARGGHGVDWNDERRGTVQRAAGHPVRSVFSTVHAAGGSTALFVGKTKLGLFKRSWPRSVDHYRYEFDADTLVSATRRDLRTHDRSFTFLHLHLPDTAGHASGWMSRPYLAAVRQTDRLVGDLLRTVRQRQVLRRHLVVILTADHGGIGTDHGDPTLRADYRIPFLVWGAGVEPGDLYDLNPRRRDPGRARTTYAGRQPVRNGDLASLSSRLVGAGPVRGAEFGHKAPLRLR